MILHLGWLRLYTKAGLFVLFSEPFSRAKEYGCYEAGLVSRFGGQVDNFSVGLLKWLSSGSFCLARLVWASRPGLRHWDLVALGYFRRR